MKLYLLPGCPFAHRASIALNEKQQRFEPVFFERGKRPRELEALGPMAKSPTLFDGDTKVFESQVVLEYIEDRWSEPQLLPGAAAGRAEVRLFGARVAEELMPKFGEIIRRVLFEPKRDEEKIAEAKKAFVDALEPWDKHFEGRNFAVGQQLTLADVTLYPVFVAAQRVAGVDIPTERKHLRAWRDRIGARPSAKPLQPNG